MGGVSTMNEPIMSAKRFSEVLNQLLDKKVQIDCGEYGASGILRSAQMSLDAWAKHRFQARLEQENGKVIQIGFNSLGNIKLSQERPEPHDTTEKLSTIQKRENLNEVYRTGEPGPGGAYHDYDIYPAGMSVGFKDEFTEIPMACIEFQKGPRKDPNARHGVLDSDLLEIVRDRLKAFQSGPYACRENEDALVHVEAALYWMNRRVEDRIKRGVLGTMEK